MTSEAIVCVGLSHKSAPIGIRERLAIGPSTLPEVIDDLVAATPLREVAVLSTCNRVEIYGALPRGAAGSPRDVDEACRAILGRLTTLGGEAVREHLTARRGREALLHLFRVASSLDSLVVGEPQILGQLKEAVDVARQRGALGALLGRAMHRALHVGKRVRSETSIGEGQVSVSSVAVDLASQIFGQLKDREVVLIGAGEMAEAAAKAFAKHGARLVVVNRSLERAEKLASEVSGSPRAWRELDDCLATADVVVSSTSSPEPVITVEKVKAARKARRNRSLFLIDIAVPRDVDPRVNRLDDVYLYDVDDLSKIVALSLEGRAAEAAKAELIVTSEADAFEAWTVERTMTPAIVGLRARTKSILTSELDRSLSGRLKHLGAAEREALTAMVEAATNKLCHAPSTHLKAMARGEGGEEAVVILRDLFELPEVDASGHGEAMASEPEARSARPPAEAAEAAPPRKDEARPTRGGDRV